jgi:hypothetical protein
MKTGQILLLVAVGIALVWLFFRPGKAEAATAGGGTASTAGETNNTANTAPTLSQQAAAEEARLRAIYNSMANTTDLNAVYSQVQVPAARFREATGVQLPVENDAANYINVKHKRGGLAGVVQTAGGFGSIFKTAGPIVASVL